VTGTTGSFVFIRVTYIKEIDVGWEEHRLLGGLKKQNEENENILLFQNDENVFLLIGKY